MTTLLRCCTGGWYLLPNGTLFSWAVICRDCDRILSIHDGTREAVIEHL